MNVVEPDWQDVLRRAGRRRRGTLGRRAALAATAATLALLATIPAFGVSSRLRSLVEASDAPGLELRAVLRAADGSRVGTFSVRTSRLFVAVPRGGRRARPFSRPGALTPGVPARWRLDLEPGATGASARLERTTPAGTTRVADLCARCASSTEGSLRLRRPAVAALFGRRLVVVVTTSQGAVRAALRLEPRR